MATGNRRTATLPFDSRSVAVPRMGKCSAIRATHGEIYFLLCGSAFRSEPDLVSVRFIEPEKSAARAMGPYKGLRRLSYSPFPADLDISPVSQYFTFTIFRGKLSDVVIESVEPLAHLQREFEIDGLRLGEFEAKPTVH